MTSKKVTNIDDYKKSKLDFEKKKVDLQTIKDLIERGLYNPSADKVAESLLETEAKNKNKKSNSNSDSEDSSDSAWKLYRLKSPLCGQSRIGFDLNL